MADTGNCRVVVLRSTDGAWVRQLKGPPGTLRWPVGVVVVPSTGQVLVSDGMLHRVVRFQSIVDDTVVGMLGTGRGNGVTEFKDPRGMVVLERKLFSYVLWSLAFG